VDEGQLAQKRQLDEPADDPFVLLVSGPTETWLGLVLTFLQLTALNHNRRKVLLQLVEPSPAGRIFSGFFIIYIAPRDLVLRRPFPTDINDTPDGSLSNVFVRRCTISAITAIRYS
jgi:hypothetical protein